MNTTRRFTSWMLILGIVTIAISYLALFRTFRDYPELYQKSAIFVAFVPFVCGFVYPQNVLSAGSLQGFSKAVYIVREVTSLVVLGRACGVVNQYTTLGMLIPAFIFLGINLSRIVLRNDLERAQCRLQKSLHQLFRH